MNRSVAVETLRSLGVPEVFLNKPGVVERIYGDYAAKHAAALKSASIQVESDKKFLYDGPEKGKEDTITFEIKDDDRIHVSHGDIEIKLNEYGIEVSLRGGESAGYTSIMERESGTVRHFEGRDSDGWYDETIGTDNGSWSIEQAVGTTIERNHQRGDKVNIGPTLSVFDINADEITDFYPETAHWYEAKRTQLIRAVENHNQAKEAESSPEATVEYLGREVTRLQDENKRLRSSNEKLTHMLGVTLEFADDVRRSPVGNLFFGRKLRKVERSSNQANIHKAREGLEQIK